jgi:hypothetical protein
LAFDANPNGSQELFVVEVDGGRPHPVSAEFDNVLVSDWSRDGRWLYFAAERDGEWDLWRLAATGSADAGAVRVTAGSAIRGHECADGFFYYARPREAGLWRLPLDAIGSSVRPDNESSPWLRDLPAMGRWRSWGIGQGHIVLLVEGDGDSRLVRHHPESGRRTLLTHLPGPGSGVFALARDGTTCYFVRIEGELSDLMLVEGFR